LIFALKSIKIFSLAEAIFLFLADGGRLTMLKSRVARYFQCVFLLILMTGLVGIHGVFAQEPTVQPISAGGEPTITDFTPTQAIKGETVVITGTNFTGATEVRFGEKEVSSFTVDSDTQITAVIGDGGTGDAKVVAPGGTTSKSGFKYLLLELKTKIPVVSGESTQSFSVDVDINYQAPDLRQVNLDVTPPKDWIAYVQSSYPETQLAAINMGPSESFPATERVSVHFQPLYPNSTDPGEYIATLKATAGDLKASLDLSAKITARYSMSLTTETGRLNTNATAGSDSHYTIKVVNSGTGNLEDINFSASKPEGWTIKFDPEKLDGIDAGLNKDVDVIINAPKGKTVAGDYMITINANAKNGRANMDVRVTVLTPSIMGWVGIIIVVLVIAGLAILFWRMGRR
jgi:uncharacterized membrane protein